MPEIDALSTPAAWEQRFRAIRISLPEWADDAPSRSLYLSNATGTFELYTWDRDTGVTAQATRRANGTYSGALPPDGEHVWWFADIDGDEYGIWMRQPFDGGPGSETPAIPGLQPAYPAGLALGRDGVVIVGGADEGRTVVTLVRGDVEPVVVYENERDAYASDLSRDNSLLCLQHSEHGDSRHMALRVVRLEADGSTTLVGDLWDGPGKGLDGLGFSPVEGDARVLVRHERREQPALLVWDPTSGETRELEIDLPGEISADWYPDGTALLVQYEHQARSGLARYDLTTDSLTRIDTPTGIVSSAHPRPDGSVEYAWSCSAEPAVLRSTGTETLLRAPDPRPRQSVPAEDAWVDGPGGKIHALVSKPLGEGPFPGLFLVHGGPEAQDEDSFDNLVATWVDAGMAVVRVNYRGSTGYGVGWRDALIGRPGLTELEDLAAVRAWSVESGLLDPRRIAIAGGSWGGYLTLLALGVQPKDWALGIAAAPIGDYVASYEDQMDPLKGYDDAMFGGNPSEVPEKYAASSPITYVESVQAPVFLIAGENDPRTPIRQVENYQRRLDELGATYEVYRYDAGHGSLVIDERIKQMRLELDFVRRHLPS